ncbi:MAG: hypothetical protein ABJA74_12690 [Lapillicoccus sp.]
MSAPEDRFGKAVHDALHDDAELRPSPDLFSRVVDSIDADRLRRRRRRTVVLLWAGALLVVTTAVVILTPRNPEGALVMSWWVLELATTSLLIAIALWLGPFIKRFGRAYAADVFHDNPLTGKSYIVLTDVVYYLIFTAYIFFTAHFETPEDWHAPLGNVTAGQAQAEVARVGGILLIIGILHGLNIVLMPVLGRLFSLNRRLPPGSVPRRLQSDDADERSIYRRAAELEREADDGPR